MDNRLNQIRKKINVFRAEMSIVETAMRKQIAHDQECVAAATLLEMRKQLAVMIEEFTALGGPVQLPTIDERLKQSHRPGTKGAIFGARSR
jgi:S-adenosylhomocysteine hydrolase